MALISGDELPGSTPNSEANDRLGIPFPERATKQAAVGVKRRLPLRRGTDQGDTRELGVRGIPALQARFFKLAAGSGSYPRCGQLISLASGNVRRSPDVSTEAAPQPGVFLTDGVGDGHAESAKGHPANALGDRRIRRDVGLPVDRLRYEQPGVIPATRTTSAPQYSWFLFHGLLQWADATPLGPTTLRYANLADQTLWTSPEWCDRWRYRASSRRPDPGRYRRG